MKKLSTSELAQYLCVTKRTVQRRAIKESWVYEERVGLGGTKRLYDFSSLPENVKAKVVACIVARHESYDSTQLESLLVQQDNETPFIAEYEQDPSNWLSQHCFNHQVDNAELNKDYIKLGLLALARLFVDQAGEGKIKGFDEFCRQYNTRALDIDPEVYAIVRHISRISLLRWEKKEQEMADFKDIDASVSDAGVFMDKDLRQVAQEIIMVSPKITATRMREHFLTFFPDKKIPDEAQLRLWIRQSK